MAGTLTLALAVMALGVLLDRLLDPADLPALVEPTGDNGEAMLTGRGGLWRIAFELFEGNPLFGYGLTAWRDEFRASIGIANAWSAHNQFLQSLSVAGLFGLAGLLVYLGILIVATWRAAGRTRGLAPALLVITLLRCLTEVPFELGSILIADFITHLLWLRLLVSPSEPQQSNAWSGRAAVAAAELAAPRGALAPGRTR